MIGKTVTDYKILDKLGGGGMGVVYTARDTKLDRLVALKFLPPDLSRDEDAKARFTQEAKAASALNHQNICAIHDIRETDDGQLFIVMALYDGQTLKHRLSEGALDEKEAISISRQIADGLTAAHEKGITHRDIKPANIMVTDKGRAVILDFGLAKLAGGLDLTKTGSTLGTTYYMSPEQTRGEPVDNRTDIWSLGAILYEMVSGRRPFRGDYDQAVIYSILNSDPEPLGTGQRIEDSGQSAQFERVISKALAKDVNDRYASASDFIDDLDAIEAGGVVAAPKRPFRRNLVYASLAAVAVLIAVALTVLIPNNGKAIDSIAVLPLANLSGDPGQAYLADGITDALINELSKISALRVISRRSVMRFKDSDLPLQEIAAELGVDAIVDGSVIRSGNDIRVTAQLISVTSDENLWADSFDHELKDILTLHAEVARAIANEIEVELTPEEDQLLSTRREVDPEAYEAFLQGRFNAYKNTPEGYRAARGYFEAALEKDPNWAPAYAALARAWIGSGLWGGLLPREAIDKGRASLLKALALDDQLSDAHHVLAVLNFIYLWEYEQAEAEFNKAIDLRPNIAEHHLMYADYLNSMLRPEEATSEARLGVELDPLNAFSHGLLAWILLCNGTLEEAIEQHKKTLSMDPTLPLALRGLWELRHRSGDYDEARRVASRFYRAQGLDEAADILVIQTGHSYEETMTLAAEALESVSDDRYVPSMRIARLYAHAGAHEKAIELLEKAREERFPSIPAVNVDPHWSELRDHPRFQALVREINLQL